MTNSNEEGVEAPAPKDAYDLHYRMCGLINEILPIILKEHGIVYSYAVCELMASICFLTPESDKHLEHMIDTTRGKFEFKQKHMIDDKSYDS